MFRRRGEVLNVLSTPSLRPESMRKYVTPCFTVPIANSEEACENHMKKNKHQIDCFQLEFTSSKFTIETPEQCAKCVQS